MLSFWLMLFIIALVYLEHFILNPLLKSNIQVFNILFFSPSFFYFNNLLHICGIFKLQRLWNKYWILVLKLTGQKMKSPIKDFFSKCDQIRRKLPIWSHLLKKSLMEDFIFCAVTLFTGAVLSQLTNIKIAIFQIIHLSFQKGKN